MTVRELREVLCEYGVDINIHTYENYDEEISDIDVWSVDYFEHYCDRFNTDTQD